MGWIPSHRRAFAERLVLGLIALGALLLRLYYVNTAVVDHPVRGDAVQYYSYAWNLLHHGIFSGALPHTPRPVADGFRDPGYPAFLAVLAGSGDMQDAFLHRVLHVQCLLSAATVWIFALLARRWIGFAGAVGTGVVFALWPHTITQAGYLLSETLLGFLVALALLALDGLVRDGRAWRAIVAGLAFAIASLTNAVVAPFAPLMACLMVWKDVERRQLWMIVFVASVLPLAAWSIRGSLLPEGQGSSADRAKMNLVQGSWPEYHPAYAASLAGDAKAAALMKAIDDEYLAIHANTRDGLGLMFRRIGQEPGRYVLWYLSKPKELWGWNIGIGQGDIYVYPTYRSPLEGQPILRATTGLLFFLTPFVLLFAAIGVVLAFARPSRTSLALRFTAALGLWITLVYGILQSDARYATPFRGIEIVLAVFTVRAALIALADRRTAFASGRITS